MKAKFEKLLNNVLHQHKNNNMQVFMALTIGACVGAVAGILLAPTSGKKLRDRLCGSCSAIKNETEELVEETKEKVTRKKPKSDIKKIIEEAHTPDSKKEE